MSGARGVLAGDGAFAVAVAELPLSTLRAAAVAGSVVVIGGEAGWGARLRRAVDGGAAAVILSEPAGIEASEFRDAGAVAVPVIVDRARLRADVVADALQDAPPRAVQVECGAASIDVPTVLRDAVGWARALAGGELDVRAARATSRAVMIELRRGVVAASVLLGRRDTAAASWMRALAIDVRRTEVMLQHPVGSPLVARTDGNGTTQSPPRYESHERLAIRRALEALDAGGHPADLDELEHDSRIAAQALA